MHGLTTREIAEKHGEKAKTVKNRIAYIRSKFVVSTKEQAVTKAIEEDALPVEELAKEFDFTHMEKLTPKELCILYELTNDEEGTSNAQIGERLGIDGTIVRDVLDRVYSKYAVKNRSHAAGFFATAQKVGKLAGRIKEYEEYKERNATAEYWKTFGKSEDDNYDKKITDQELTILVNTTQGVKGSVLAKFYGKPLREIQQQVVNAKKKLGVKTVAQAVMAVMDQELLASELIEATFEYERLDQLSDQEMRILYELAQAENTKKTSSIAKILGHSTKRINIQIQDILETLNVRSRHEAAVFFLLAQKRGVTTYTPPREEVPIEETQDKVKPLETIAAKMHVIYQAAKDTLSPEEVLVADIRTLPEHIRSAKAIADELGVTEEEAQRGVELIRAQNKQAELVHA